MAKSLFLEMIRSEFACEVIVILWTATRDP